MPDFREIFSVEAVEERFKAIAPVKPARNAYYSTALEEACLLGSFEHAVLGKSEWGNLVATASGLSERVVRSLEAGWEDFEDFESLTGGFKTQEEVDAYEWGIMLGNNFCGQSGE